MREAVITHVQAMFAAHSELVEHLPEEALGQALPVPSSTIGQQLWCINGARESFTSAIVEGVWVGYDNSLAYEDSARRAVVRAALESSARTFEAAIAGVAWDSARHGLLLDLLEHEAQHQGQLIRYVYALPYRFPASWAERWALNS